MPVQYGVGVAGLNKLSADLRRAADKEMLAEIRSSFKAAAELVKAEAKQNFSWSSRIPGSVRSQIPYGNITHVRVLAGGKRAPHAAAFENHGQPGTFRHPVFANRGLHGDRSVPWVDQQARPGLLPALQSKIEAVIAEVRKGIDRAFTKAGAR